jgi:hypothetical protein
VPDAWLDKVRELVAASAQNLYLLKTRFHLRRAHDHHSLAKVPVTVTVPLGNISWTFQIDTADSPIATTAMITASDSDPV